MACIMMTCQSIDEPWPVNEIRKGREVVSGMGVAVQG